MSSQWSYLVLVLCISVTSSAVLDHPGNQVSCHGDEFSDVKGEETLTPPTETKGMEEFQSIHTNDSLCRELCKNGHGGIACLCDWPPLKKQVLFSLKKSSNNPRNFIKFPTIEDEPACKILCPYGDEGHFCWCGK